MKTYRLKKWYPSLPERLKSGCSIFIEDDRYSVMLEWESHLLSRTELECEEYWEDTTPKECTCNSPRLQEQTRECGGCKNYIDKEKHIILTERNRLIDEFVGDNIFVGNNRFLDDDDVKHYIRRWENFKDNRDA